METLILKRKIDSSWFNQIHPLYHWHFLYRLPAKPPNFYQVTNKACFSFESSLMTKQLIEIYLKRVKITLHSYVTASKTSNESI